MVNNKIRDKNLKERRNILNRTDERKLKFYELLCNEKSYKPTAYYCRLLDVSRKTILNYIDSLNSSFKQYDVCIEKKPRHGIKITGLDTNNYVTLKKAIFSLNNLSSDERKSQILFKMLCSKKGLKLNDLKSEYFISEASLKNDFNEIEKFIKHYDVILKTHQGEIFLSGKESKIQVAVTNYLSENNQTSFGISDQNDHPSFMCNDVFEELDSKELRLAEKVFNEFFCNKNLSKEYISFMFLTVVIQIMRLKIDKHILNTSPINEKTMSLYLTSYNLSRAIENAFSLHFWSSDISFLAERLYAFHMKPLPLYNSADKKLYENEILNLINRVSDFLGVDLANDQELFESLMGHIIPLIYRLKKNIFIKNPLFEEIKNRYSFLYFLIYYSSEKMFQKFDVTVTGDEISFLTIYFQISLEKKGSIPSKKVYVITSDNSVISKLIFARVRKILPQPNAVDEIEYTKAIKSMATSTSDIFVSTIPLPQSVNKENIIQVSPFMDENDIERIVGTYYSNVPNKSWTINSEGKNLFNKKLVFAKQNFKSKEECLQFWFSKYTAENLVQAGFEDSVLLRERMGDTSYSTNVALPHPDPQFVPVTSIGIMTLNKKILWGVNKVNFIIFLAISNDDALSLDVQNFVRNLFNFIDNPANREKVENACNQQELLNIFNSEGDEKDGTVI